MHREPLDPVGNENRTGRQDKSDLLGATETLFRAHEEQSHSMHVALASQW